MELDGIVQILGKWVSGGLEVFGVGVIGLAFFHAVARAIIQFFKGDKAAFLNMKVYLGKALQLALEFLVAADIIQTVTIEVTREGLLTLGMLVVLRTMLSWSITVEIEGRWPWQAESGREAESK
jgi:uncharacterized membrane protein